MFKFAGDAGTHYTNNSGRNDFSVLKAARDGTNVYFYAQTVQPITASIGTNWMWLFIDADQNATTGWEGYDFVVNRITPGNGTAWLEKTKAAGVGRKLRRSFSA